MEPLKDPCKDRPCASLPAPPAAPLTKEILCPSGEYDVQLLKEHLLREGRIDRELMNEIIAQVTEIFLKEPTLLKLKDPITVVGDIHGQYYDFVKVLDVGGAPPDVQYIFLGDYVDRGSYSVEVLCLIFVLKIKYPTKIWMLRGNHECRQMTSFFNFRDECEYKHDTNVYNAFMEAFDALPLAGTINGKFLSVHGGLSPDLTNLRQLKDVHRFSEPPREGIICDIIWSDPQEEKDGAPPPPKDGPKWIKNEVRGCSYFFSFDAAVGFLSKNSLLSVIRAHEAQIEGYKMHRTNASTGFPTVITIFSAPNYCDVYNNKGAVLKFDNNALNILQFAWSEHPYHLPNFMDIFAWSMPFVVEKVTEMLYHILQPTADDPVDDEPPDLPPTMNRIFRNSLSKDQNEAVELAARLASHIDGNPIGENKEGSGAGDGEGSANPASVISKEKGDRLRRKVRTVARMARMFKTLRQENETVVRLKGVCPGHKLSPGLLLQGKDGLKTEMDRFENAKGIDTINEARPELPPDGDPASPR